MESSLHFTPLSLLLVILLRLGGDQRGGRAEVEHRKHKQMVDVLLAPSRPMPARRVLVRGWVAGKPNAPVPEILYAS